jgi:LacI family transcriptional regulator
MTTINDVAKLAGVSIAAASYALNGTGTIADETRQRVLEAAEELNYYPNASARNLKRGKTQTLGVFITRFGGSFYEEILEGIHEAVLKTDYELMVCPESKSTPRLLTQRQVDGAIVFDSKTKSKTLLQLASQRFPIVALDRVLNSEYVFPLLLDNQGGARVAFHHLYEQGVRRFGFVSGAPDSLDNHERMRTFLREAAKHDVPVSRYFGDFTEKSGYYVGRLMVERNDRPEGIFCANDQMAIGFLRALKESGLNAPSDIAVVGFDDIQIAAYMQPSLSTIGASRVEWGATAARQLINFLENDRTFPEPFRISTRLIPRESSRKKEIENV